MNHRDTGTKRNAEAANSFSFLVPRPRLLFLSVSATLRIICLAIGMVAISGCSIPNLEKPQCTAGREVVKRFYSMHFGSEMSSSPERVREREKFLTVDLIRELGASADSKKDYFTATENYPKAFRVGECTVNSEENVTLQVVLLWRNDEKNEQKEVLVETVGADGKWLINKVSN